MFHIILFNIHINQVNSIKVAGGRCTQVSRSIINYTLQRCKKDIRQTSKGHSDQRLNLGFKQVFIEKNLYKYKH